MWLFLRCRGFAQLRARGAVGRGQQFCESVGAVVSAPSTLHVASVPFTSEHRPALLCLPRPLALYLLQLGRFGSDPAPADRAAAVEPFEEGLKSRLLVNEYSIVLLFQKTVEFFLHY